MTTLLLEKEEKEEKEEKAWPNKLGPSQVGPKRKKKKET